MYVYICMYVHGHMDVYVYACKRLCMYTCFTQQVLVFPTTVLVFPTTSTCVFHNPCIPPPTPQPPTPTPTGMYQYLNNILATAVLHCVDLEACPGQMCPPGFALSSVGEVVEHLTRGGASRDHPHEVQCFLGLCVSICRCVCLYASICMC